MVKEGVLLNPDRLKKLEKLGLEHVQLSFQDTDNENEKSDEFNSSETEKKSAKL